MKKQKAFTLIELMVVMAIIAILATAGISAYSGYTKKARDTSRVEIGRTIESSVLGLMASNNGRAPTPTALKSALTNEGIEIKDPAGGGSTCLGTDGTTPNQPCRFDYVAYDDGSYSISYGVESPDSTKANFYQTTFDTLGGGTLTKVGVYRGSAPFVGAAVNTTYQPTLPNLSTLIAIPSNLDAKITTNDRLDTATSGSGGGGSALTCTPTCGTGATCTESGCKCGTLFTCTNNQICTNDTTCSCPGSFPTTCGGTCVNTNTDAAYCGDCNTQCQSGDVCTAGVCTAPFVCGTTTVTGPDGITYATVVAEDTRCWLATNLGTTHAATSFNDSAAYGNYYQWGRSDTTFTPVSVAPTDWSDPQDNTLWDRVGGVYKNNPCPTGFHVPTSGEWTALASAIPSFYPSAGEKRLIAVNSALKLPTSGYNYASIANSYFNRGQSGYYWSSTPNGIFSYMLTFNAGNTNPASSLNRAYGLPIRCIQDQ